MSRSGDKVTKDILKTAMRGGVVTVNEIISLVLGPKYDFKLERARRSYIRRRLTELLQQGLIVWGEEDGKKYIYLTERGQLRLESYALGEVKIKQPKRWDGKWRVVIFDIHERRRRTRDLLRRQLSNLGLVRLQNSVWVYPYDFSKLVTLFKVDEMIGRGILYLTVEELENDRWLRKHFKLPLDA